MIMNQIYRDQDRYMFVKILLIFAAFYYAENIRLF